jgi:hypothetical protein
MKYSEAKKMIKVLHADGWEKMKGFVFYRKRWSMGDFHYQQTLPFAQLQYSLFSLEYILKHENEKAEFYLEQQVKSYLLYGEVL